MDNIEVCLIHYVFENDVDEKRIDEVKKNITRAVQYYDISPEGNIAVLVRALGGWKDLCIWLNSLLRKDIREGENLYVSQLVKRDDGSYPKIEELIPHIEKGK